MATSLAELTELRGQVQAQRERIEALMLETGAQLEEFASLRASLLDHANEINDVALKRWIVRETKRNQRSINAMNKAFEEMAEERMTQPENNPDEWKLKMEHELAIEKNLLEQLELRKSYLLGALDRMRKKSNALAR